MIGLMGKITGEEGRVFCFQAEDGIRGAQESRGLGDVYKRQELDERQIRRYYTERARPVTRAACRAVWLSGFIMPSGEVLPCLDYSYGNLNDRPFGELWNGPRARAFRKRLRAAGIFPGCVRCCLLYAF